MGVGATTSAARTSTHYTLLTHCTQGPWVAKAASHLSSILQPRNICTHSHALLTHTSPPCRCRPSSSPSSSSLSHPPCVSRTHPAGVVHPPAPQQRHTLTLCSHTPHHTHLPALQVSSILQPLSSGHEPAPTYFRTNKFTECFNNIVEAYGVARYREVGRCGVCVCVCVLNEVMLGNFGCLLQQHRGGVRGGQIPGGGPLWCVCVCVCVCFE